MCVPGCARSGPARDVAARIFHGRGGGRGFAATAVTPAQAQRSFTSVIDLTHTLSPEFPTFFGMPGIAVEKRYTLKKDGANVNWWHVVEHAGTHVDAPIHYSDAGAAAETIPAEQLVVPLAVVDVSAKAARNADYAMTRAGPRRLGGASTAACPTAAASRCIRAGRSTSATRRNSPARMRPA